MKLYFKNSRGEKRLIAEPKNRDDAWEYIHAFCEERNFRIYYARTWRDDNGLEVYDVSSWDEFFLLDDKS